MYMFTPRSRESSQDLSLRSWNCFGSSLLGWVLESHSKGLVSDSLILSASGLDLSSLLLFLELGLSDLLLLHLVDGLDKNSLVSVLVTLGSEVEEMVDISGDLLGLSILSEESSEDSLSSHPLDLNWHSSVSGTSSLTVTLMSALSLGLMHSLDSGSRVHSNLSLNDETILIELSNVLSYMFN
jgi:hypothetical protein